MSGASKRDSIQPGLVGIDGAWDELAPPDPESVTVTARPPAPLVAEEPRPFSDVPPPADGQTPRANVVQSNDLHEEGFHIDLDLDPVEPKIDIAAASRAANTAAALGRAPRPHTTMKMKAVDLAEALARSAAIDEEEKKKPPKK